MLQRQSPPSTPPLAPFKTPEVVRHTIAGVPLFHIPHRDAPMVALQLLFPAGSWYEAKKGVASLTAEMLTRGSHKRDRHAIAEEIAYHGADLTCSATRDAWQITLCAPQTLYLKTLPLLKEVLQAPAFPARALDALKPILQEQIAHDAADPQSLGMQQLRQQIFGAQHPYGYTLMHADLQAIQPQDLATHHAQHGTHPTALYICGHITEAHITALEQLFPNTHPPQRAIKHPLSSTPSSTAVPHKSATQTIIHMGHTTISPSHPDYFHWYITNTLLGGFFGSRLMQNIREAKGYTYGIHTAIVHHQNSSFWYLETATKREAAQATRGEIQRAIERLQQSPIDRNELALLKSYLIGRLRASFDSPLATLKQLPTLQLHQLPPTHFDQYHQAITTIDPHTIQAIAQKYCMPSSLSQVTVERGPSNR